MEKQIPSANEIFELQQRLNKANTKVETYKLRLSEKKKEYEEKMDQCRKLGFETKEELGEYIIAHKEKIETFIKQVEELGASIEETLRGLK